MPSPAAPHPEHIFTVDVEEYFQVNSFERVVARADWDRFPSRVERSVDVLLDRLARREALGTFFVLGWIADRHPRVVRRIADAGHEIASHGWWHRRVTMLTADEFREDVRSSRAVLQDVSGQPVLGYRAPSFSIVPGREWAFDVLVEEGYGYDSSLFPIRRPGYGYPGAPVHPHAIERPSGSLTEFPLTTAAWMGLRVPAAGGGYFRHFPYALTRRAFRACAAAGMPGVFYIHPWEIDPEQPRMPVPWLTRLRHYRGIARTLARLDRLLADFRFTSVARHLAPQPAQGGAHRHEGAHPRAVVPR